MKFDVCPGPKSFPNMLCVRFSYTRFCEAFARTRNMCRPFFLFSIFKQEEEKQRREMEERDRNFQRLLSVVDQRLVANQEEFQCPICFDDVGVGEGVVLRECLHNFCRFV